MGKPRRNRNETRDIMVLAHLRKRSLLFGNIALFSKRCVQPTFPYI